MHARPGDRTQTHTRLEPGTWQPQAEKIGQKGAGRFTAKLSCGPVPLGHSEVVYGQSCATQPLKSPEQHCPTRRAGRAFLFVMLGLTHFLLCAEHSFPQEGALFQRAGIQQKLLCKNSRQKPLLIQMLSPASPRYYKSFLPSPPAVTGNRA